MILRSRNQSPPNKPINKPSIRDIIKVHEQHVKNSPTLPPPHNQPPKQIARTYCPPSHIESELSESLEVSEEPPRSAVVDPVVRTLLRKKFFKNLGKKHSQPNFRQLSSQQSPINNILMKKNKSKKIEPAPERDAFQPSINNKSGNVEQSFGQNRGYGRSNHSGSNNEEKAEFILSQEPPEINSKTSKSSKKNATVEVNKPPTLGSQNQTSGGINMQQNGKANGQPSNNSYFSDQNFMNSAMKLSHPNPPQNNHLSPQFANAAMNLAQSSQTHQPPPPPPTQFMNAAMTLAQNPQSINNMSSDNHRDLLFKATKGLAEGPQPIYEKNRKKQLPYLQQNTPQPNLGFILPDQSRPNFPPPSSQTAYDNPRSSSPKRNYPDPPYEQIQQLEQKLRSHDIEISDLRRKIIEIKQKEQEDQKKMLVDLIKKQEQLCEKQSEMNTQLQRILALQNENHAKKEQINRYELQLQRAKRMESISLENQRLYQELLSKIHNKNYKSKINRDITPTTDIMGGMSSNLGPHLGSFKDQNSHSISALQPNRYDEGHDDSIGELLSPFAINPNDF